MSVSVYIPSPFRRLTANREYVEVEGRNVGEVLDAVEARFPGFGDLVYDRERKVPTHINIYVNNQEIHDLEGIATEVADGDQVAVIPALAGGSAIPALAGGSAIPALAGGSGTPAAAGGWGA